MRAGFIQFAGFAVLALLVGCSTSMQPVTPSGSSSIFQDDGSSRGKIKHVVIIVQENRSFDNFFDCFPGTDCVKSAPPPAPQPEPTKRDNPCPVMPTPSPGPTATPIQLQLNQKLTAFDIDHSYCAAFVQDYDGGKMDGFYWNLGGPAGVAKAYAYRVVAEKQIQPYWDMAQQYVLADRTFPTQASGSFTAHQDLIRGDTVVAKNESVIDYPWNSKYAPLWGCDDVPGSVTSLITSKKEYLYNKGPFPCFSYETIRDTLDAKDVSWKYYVPTWPNNEGQYWNAFDAIDAVRHDKNEWPNKPKFNCTNSCVSWPQTNVLCDIAGSTQVRARAPNPPGSVVLPAVSWVIPDGEDSDHGIASAKRNRSRLGGVGRQRNRQKSVLELHGNLHRLGRLGRLLRPYSAPTGRLSGSGGARPDDRRVTLCQERLHLARSVRVRQPVEVRRIHFRVAQPRDDGRTRKQSH